jgi:hypothetical protein
MNPETVTTECSEPAASAESEASRPKIPAQLATRMSVDDLHAVGGSNEAIAERTWRSEQTCSSDARTA